MAKRDLNYIKHVRPQVHKAERKIKSYKSLKPYREAEQRLRDLEIHRSQENENHKHVCKEAANMSVEERLMNYCHTLDGTYLGNGCEWDLLTKLGRDKFGKIIESIL